MTKRRRQALLLAALLLALAYALWSQLGGLLGGGGSGGSRREKAQRQLDQVASTEVVDLRLGMLRQKPGEYSPGRDPFNFGGGLPAQRKTPPPRPRNPRPQKPKPPPQQPPPTKAAKPVPPPIDVDYLGSFGPEGRRIAVFTDGLDIINAMVGDTVMGKFIVDSIGYESVDLKYVGFPDDVKQRLGAGVEGG